MELSDSCFGRTARGRTTNAPKPPTLQADRAHGVSSSKTNAASATSGRELGVNAAKVRGKALLLQRRDPALQAFEGQWIHVRTQRLEHHLCGARISPRTLRFRVEPYGSTVSIDQPFEPRQPWLVVDVFHAPAGLHQLVRSHGRISYVNQPTFRTVLV